jgi:hypothetical protein
MVEFPLAACLVHPPFALVLHSVRPDLDAVSVPHIPSPLAIVECPACESRS